MGWLLLGVAAGWSLRPARSNPAAPVHDWCWWLLLAGVLLAFRWPLIWLPHELYPDESQLLSGALTLRHDPVFWRSVDGGTAGPLDFYALFPAAFFPGVTGYAVARITAVGLIWGILAAISGTLTLVASRPVARITVLPLLAFEAFTTSPEFVHYSTELVPAALLAAAGYAFARQAVRPTTGNLWLAALLLGALPYSKLQAVPIAGVIGLFLVGQEISSGRKVNLGPVIIATLLPTLLVLTAVTLTGQGENLLIPYLLENLVYARTARQSIGVVAQEQWDQTLTNGYLAFWLAGSGIFLLLARFFAGKAGVLLHRFGLFAASLLATAVFCILAPGRPYQHYLTLLAMPLCLLTGAVLAGKLQPAGDASAVKRPVLVGTFLLCALVPQIVWRASNRPDPYEYYNTVLTAPGRAHRQLVESVQALTGPGEALGIWGWRSSLYVETGLRQATRQAHTEAQLARLPWQEYFLRRYYEDISAALPPVFADAVGPGNFRFQDRRWAHESFPLLREWVGAHYTYVGEWDGVRVYARNDRRPAAAK